MNQLETLLQRYKEGVITPDEQTELDRLTNRHQVFSAASAQASAMRRRRYAVVSSVASLLIVAGIAYSVWSTNDTHISDGPTVAQYHAGQLPVATENPAPQAPAPAIVQQPVTSTPAAVVDAVQPMPRTPDPAKPQSAAPACPTPAAVAQREPELTEPSSILSSETVVACNTQCSPDSVINDIWNFLKA